jgi:D-glycero-alpha-D-manno-heptose 1-phosphate guanylyltransferase
LISTGIYRFRSELLGRFATHTPASLEQEVFPALTASGAFLKVLPTHTPFLDIGLPETLGQADGFVRANQGEFELSEL